MDMRADVLIVGAGMVGSALALALQDSGLQVLLLDGSPLSVKPFDRASSLRTPGQRAVGGQPADPASAWAPGTAHPRAAPQPVLRHAGVGRQRHRADPLSAASVHAEVLGHIVENRVVQDASAGAPARHATSACWPTRAPGADAPQRRRLAADPGRWPHPARAAGDRRRWRQLGRAPPDRLPRPASGTTCITPSSPAYAVQQPHQRHRLATLHRHGPLAFLPLVRDGQEDWCSIVWSTTPARPSA